MRPRDHLLPEDLSLEFPVTGITALADLPALDGQELGLGGRHCRSLSAPDEESESASWDVSSQASQNQTLKQSLQQWRSKMKKSHIKDKKKQVINDRQAALEKDVAQLQTRLHDEKMHRMCLEQALAAGASDLISPQPASSDLAPQSQQLITEILSLQKEVSYLEQRAHSLYHRLLNQKLSVQLSTHHCGTDCSSLGAREPAMIVNVQSSDLMAKSAADQRQTPFPPRMPQNQYHIGSVATKRFGAPHSASIDVSQFKQLQPGSLLAPQNGVQPPHASFTSSQQLVQRKVSPVFHLKNPTPSRVSPVKVDTKLTLEKVSENVMLQPLPRTPNKLSEELLCCMAAIYCKLLVDPPLTKLSPLSSSPSSSFSRAAIMHESFLNSNESGSVQCRASSMSREIDPCNFHNPYSVKDMERDDVGPYSLMVEISWIHVDKERLTYAARALQNFRSMVEQLEKVDPGQMKQDEKLAFWINVYNALMMHAYLAYGIPQSRLKRLTLLQKAAYKVGPYSITAQTIEQSILGCHSNRPAQWFQALLNPGTKFKAGDERWSYALQTPEPAVCFALCCGRSSDPAVRVYTAKNVQLELEVAMREFLQASIGIRGDNKVLLPKILEGYSRERMLNSATLLEWVCKNVPRKLEARIHHCIELKPHKNPAHCLQWLPYDSGFRYIFVKDLSQCLPFSIKDPQSQNGSFLRFRHVTKP